MSKNKILIVEDDQFLADAYQSKLDKGDFDIEIAMDGQEAMEKIKNSPPDLIVLDLIMPKKDGYFVIDQLKDDTKLSKIPIIVVSNLDVSNNDLKNKKSKSSPKVSVSNLNNSTTTNTEIPGVREYLIKSNVSIDEIIDVCNKYLPKEKKAKK